VLTGETNGYYAAFGKLEHVAQALSEGYVRVHAEALGDLSGHHLIAYLQNHDQIGNRARGDRISHLVSPALVRIGAALVFVSPFVPMLFQGEEWGASTRFLYFADHRDPELADAIRRGRRQEFAAFGWRPEQIPDPLAESTYRASILDWSEVHEGAHRELLQWYAALARLRRETPELRDGRRDRMRVEFDEARRVISVQRGGITLHANLSAHAAEFSRPPGELCLHYPRPPFESDGKVVLGPESCAIWREG
jgi:maltooligosyltrehalose trehalohydrolase